MPYDKPIRNFSEFTKSSSLREKTRVFARDIAIRLLSFQKPKEMKEGWIRFPYYHHVFDDERKGFEKHLRFFSNSGDVICIDDAVKLLESSRPINGQYFCITFDDGFKNWIENAVPILVEHSLRAAFFVPTGYIGLDVIKNRDQVLNFFPGGDHLVEFLDWKDCKAIIDAGMTIGSHGVGHKKLIQLSIEDVVDELKTSKEIIEEKTEKPCTHFCCPFGRPGIDFLPESHPKIAADIGYQSFLTGHRGLNIEGDSPFNIQRDHLLANWGEEQLRYFLFGGN